MIFPGNECENQENLLRLDYSFTPREIKYLALFFRKYQKNIPDELIQFSDAVEKAIYENMSIDEVEKFFS